MSDFRQDPLWKLLGEATQPRPAPPAFVRDVMRRVREEGAPRRDPAPWAGWWPAALPGRLALAGAAVAVVLALGAGLWSGARRAAPLATAGAKGDLVTEMDDATLQLALRDFETIAQLDQLVAQAEHNLWIDGDSGF